MTMLGRRFIRLVGVGLCCVLLVAVVRVVQSRAGVAQARDEIGAVSVRPAGGNRLALDVEYTFSRSRQTPVYAGAWALKGGKHVNVGHEPVALSNWSGTATIVLQPAPDFSGTSDEYEVMLFEGGKEPFVKRQCAFPSSWGSEPSHPDEGPDLVVSAITVYPKDEAKHANKKFTVAATVKNVGSGPSGAFDVAVTLNDVMRGDVYPRANTRHQAMAPGEEDTVYSSQQEIVNNPGLFRVRVEIVPFLFKELSTCNNIRQLGFFVEQ